MPKKPQFNEYSDTGVKSQFELLGHIFHGIFTLTAGRS